MNAWEFNKMAGAFLGTLLFAMGTGLLAEAIFEEHPPEEPGYQIAIAEPTEAGAAGTGTQQQPFAVLLASATPEAGQRAAAVCQACHSFEDGGPNKVGPNLYGIVGADVLHVADFNYSSALRQWGAGKTWTYDELDHFLENPQGYIAGTIMGFAGVKDAQKRADVIVYLKSLSPNAPPLPEAPAQVASADPAATTDAAAAGADSAAAAADAAPAAAAGGADGFVDLVAAADPAQGERDAAICKACHSSEEGGPNKVGPNLYGIVGGPIVHSDTFAYSDAMKAYGGAHGEWTVALLDQYLAAPTEIVPGTKMVFAGVKDDQKRAAIVAYLRSISPTAPPLKDAAAPAAATTDTAAATPADATTTDAATPDPTAPPAAEAQDAPDAAAAPADAAAAAAPDGAAPGAGRGSGDAGSATAAASPESGSEPSGTIVQPGDPGTPPPVAADAASAGTAPADGAPETQVAAAPAGDAAPAAGEAAPAAAGDAFARLVAASTPEAGQEAARICSACHSFEEGGPDKVGPNLYGILGGKVLLSDSYNYSAAMQTFAAEHPTWTIALLDAYLAAPLKVVPGTKMAFAGIPDETRRAAVVAFLRSLSADPVPIAGADQ